MDCQRSYRNPTLADWTQSVDEMIEYRLRRELDLFVVDSINYQFPLRWREDPSTAFPALRRLTAAGVCILLVYDCYLREIGTSIGGAGKLFDLVDIAFELRDFEKAGRESHAPCEQSPDESQVVYVGACSGCARPASRPTKPNSP